MCSCFEQSLPVISILLVVILSYYVYVYELCIRLINEDFKMIAYLCVYHLLLIPFLVMYFVTMCHREWYVPSEYYLPRDLYEKMNKSSSEDVEYAMLVSFCKSRNIRLYTRTSSGSIRVCHTCKLLKPDRTHHCSTCEACVIKMDHHCPWVNNCIGFTNYKYFIILVLYGGILCTYYFATCLEYCVEFFVNLGNKTEQDLRSLVIVASNVVILGLGIALWCLLGFHLNLIFHNETTVEALHPPTFANAIIFGFDHGRGENFRQVCGSNMCYWCLPVQTHQGNGVTFEVMRYA